MLELGSHCGVGGHVVCWLDREERDGAVDSISRRSRGDRGAVAQFTDAGRPATEAWTRLRRVV